jgi:hypothetical protein
MGAPKRSRNGRDTGGGKKMEGKKRGNKNRGEDRDEEEG